MRFWFSRVLTLPNASAPSAFIVSCTVQAPDCGSRPATALSIAVPVSSVGPRMYFSAPVGSQAMSGWSCGPFERVVLRVAAVVRQELRLQLRRDPGQVAAVRRLRRRRRLEVGVRASGTASRCRPHRRTMWRRRPCRARHGTRAAHWTGSDRASAESATPGIWTTMLRPPSVVMSASATPDASTRWRMIAAAWSSCSRRRRSAVLGLGAQHDLGAALQVEREFRRPGARRIAVGVLDDVDAQRVDRRTARPSPGAGPEGPARRDGPEKK